MKRAHRRLLVPVSWDSMRSLAYWLMCAMAASSITAAICQIPAGLLVDSVRAKRLLVVISGLMVGLGCLLVVCVPMLGIVVSAQAILGAASAIIPPALAALSLGIVGRTLFPARVSRNESFNHGGNFAA